MELSFSFKKTKEEKVEKYPELPVLTFVGDEGYAKFELNKKACELLGYSEKSVTARISFAKDLSTDNLILANTTGTKTDNQCNLFLSNEFSNKKFLTRVNSKFGITLTKGDELLLKLPGETAQFPVLVVTNDNIIVEDEFADLDLTDSENDDEFVTTEKAFDSEALLSSF